MSESDVELAGTLAARLDRASQARLGRSLALCFVQAGGCGGCALEVHMLLAATYRLERLGLSVVQNPAQADVLLITGAVNGAMAEPVRLAWAAAGEPKWVVAVGDCAATGGVFAGGYAEVRGVGEVVPVDLVIAGSPPAPAEIVRALTALVEANL
ncbi:MAG: NADH-quinone oxidoreductase subunit B family protein [Acetobacteraceae bacterium]